MKSLNGILMAILCLFSSAVFAVEISADDLVGEWVFVHWAEKDTPEQTRAVNVVMDFQADGQVLSGMSRGKVTETYSVEGDTIIYHGKRGDQVWELVSFSPQESMVVNHKGSIMTFKKK